MAVRLEYLDVEKSIEYKPVIGNILKFLIEEEGKELGNINIVFTSNREILKINKKFLKHSYYTDVITFPEIKRDKVSGDIYISLEQVKINSKKLGTVFRDEVTRVIIHGVLHLLGYLDHNMLEKTVMRNKEDHYLCRFNLEDLIKSERRL